MSARVGSRASRRDLVRRLRRRPLGLAGLIGAGLFVLIAVVGPWVSPFDPLALRPETLQPPGAPYWFGTDDVGRDILSGVDAAVASAPIDPACSTARACRCWSGS